MNLNIRLIDQVKKKEVHIDYNNVVKEAPPGRIFMAFYEQMFEEENKGLKSNTEIIRILGILTKILNTLKLEEEVSNYQ